MVAVTHWICRGRISTVL